MYIKNTSLNKVKIVKNDQQPEKATAENIYLQVLRYLKDLLYSNILY